MIGGKAASRILTEVLRGVLVLPEDTKEEQLYREQVAREVDEIHGKGGMVEMPKEWP